MSGPIRMLVSPVRRRGQHTALLAALIVPAMLALCAPVAAKNGQVLDRHFLGANPVCARPMAVPVLLVADLTLTGEIDDSISLVMYDRLERLGCVSVLGIVSVFGNGRSSTKQIHHNLMVRLPRLGLARWPLLRGPDESYREVRNRRARRPASERHGTAADQARLRAIASVINRADTPAAIVELGPMTVSARLLAGGFVSSRQIGRVVGVGGRLEGERFGTNGGLVGRFGNFTDFNVRKDTKAVDYLIRHVPEKTLLVTYRLGVGERMVTAAMIEEAVPALASHARDRARWLSRMLGYTGIPSWDTWTTAVFIAGRRAKLGCARTYGRLQTEPGAKWPRLIVGQRAGVGSPITICHPGVTLNPGTPD